VKVPEPKHLPSGTWFIQLRLNGVSVPVSASSETECKRAAELIKAEHRAGKHTVQKPENDTTLAQAIDKYIASRRNRLKDRTIEQYEYIRDFRFQSVMQLPLSKITNAKLDKAVEGELQKSSRKGGTVSPKTVTDAYMLIASVLHKYAKGINTDVDLPEIQRTFPELIPPEEIFEAVKDTDIELPALLAMWLSLSMSEIRGLTKSKSIRKNKLYIVETIVDVKGKPVRKAGGKEEKRPRAFDIPPYLKKLLDAVDGDIIEPRSGHAVYMRFQRVLEQAGLPKMKFHALRHINASIMADIGIPSPIAQERGGWKTDSTMKAVYTHTFDASRRSADKRIDEYFEKDVLKIGKANKTLTEK